jgi:hypothetical protein
MTRCLTSMNRVDAARATPWPTLGSPLRAGAFAPASTHTCSSLRAHCGKNQATYQDAIGHDPNT